ncbi:MAG: HAD family hydrolase [Clostridia bacterium]|nr:HAD family hydrolase [Clostridia bacterium]
MKPFQTAIFDLDGTLLNTLDDLTDSVNHTLATFGYPTKTREEIRNAIGNGARLLIARSLPEGTSEERITELHEAYHQWYSAHSQIKTAPYDGILPLLDELRRRGIQMAVVSNKGDAQVKPLVKSYFPQIDLAVGERKDFGKKPCPDSVLDVMKQLNATPETTLYVGDSEVDVLTAQNAGIPAVAVTWGFRDKELLSSHNPDYLIDTPQELLKLF